MQNTSKKKSAALTTRNRRSYSCGPCQKLKVKCDLQTPCGSCINVSKTAHCLKCPPKPPTVQEQILTQKRRARLGVRHTRGSPPTESSDSFNSDISSTQTLSDTHKSLIDSIKPDYPTYPDLFSNSNQVVWRQLTKADDLNPSRELKVSLGSPKNSCKFFQRPETVHNILKYAFFKEYHRNRSQEFTLWPQHLSNLANELALSISKDECVTHFSEFGLRDVSGVTDLFDLSKTLSMMINFLDVFSKIKVSASIYIDADLVEQLSVSSLLVSQTYVLRGNVTEGSRWLSFSLLLRGSLNDPSDIPSVVLFGIWVVICKTSNFMFNNTEVMIATFDRFFACMSRPQIARYVQRDCLHLQDTDYFKAIARVWVLIKLSETEINYLNGHGCSQQKYLTLQQTIQPNKVLIDHLFSQSLKNFKALDSRFHAILYIGTRYFGRFEAAPVRELIYSYLRFHQEVNELDVEISESLELKIHRAKGITLLPVEYYDLLISMVFLKYFFTRLMLFVKLEKKNFPSLRFAHYVSNLICMFNWVFHLADTKEVPLDRVVSNIFDRAYFIDIQLFFGCCGIQAISVAVLKHFTSNNMERMTVDVNYLIEAITSSMNRAFECFKSSRYSGIPIISQMLPIIEGLRTYSKKAVVGVETLEEFIADILSFLGALAWDSFVLIWFGNHHVCHNHLSLLWRIASFLQTNGSNPIFVHPKFCIDTNFFRQFESLVNLFRFTADHVEQYMEHVVDAAC